MSTRLAGLVLLGIAGWVAGAPRAAAGAGPGAGLAVRRWLRWLRARTGRAVSAEQVSAEQAAACALLIAACLEAGATPAAAVRQAAGAGSGLAAAALAEAADELEAGVARPKALRSGALAAVAAVFGRSMLTGSAMSAQLVDVAAQLRSEAQFVRLERARRVGVLSVLPLGACLLPAFVLLAVVPAVLGLAYGA